MSIIGNNIWELIKFVDWLVFAFVALTVIYLLVFAIAAQFERRTSTIAKAKRYNRFIVLIPAYKQDKVILQSTNAILGQSYPQRMFDVLVISDHESEMTNMKLAQLPITLLTPNFEKSSKAKSLQYAILNLPQYKIYDAVVVLDADNIVEPEFLDQMNDALEMSGTKAIQAHRLSKNLDTASARFDAIFEEVNTSIFRRGHITLGFSSAINGSGMAYDFEWFKTNIMKVTTQGEDKEMEALLLRDGIFIDFFNDILVYDEKTRSGKDFKSQRGRWATTQLHALISNLKYIPAALFNRNYDFIDKMIQWALIPRTILMGIILVPSLLYPFIYFSMAIKWWIAAVVVLFAFALATPNYLVGKNWDRDFLYAPVITLWGLLHIFTVGRGEAHQRLSFFRRLFKRK